MDFKHITFFVDGPQEKHADLVKIVNKKYDIEEYLIAFESHNAKGEEKPHYHVIVFTTEKNFTNMLQHIVKGWTLANTSGKKGGRRNYGRLKAPIQNLQKLKIYCSKDGNVISSYSQEILDDLYRQSFKKTPKMLKEKCLNFVEAHAPKDIGYLDFPEIHLLCIEFCCIEKIHIRRTLIESYAIYIVQMSEYKSLSKSKHTIYNNLFKN